MILVVHHAGFWSSPGGYFILAIGATVVAALLVTWMTALVRGLWTLIREVQSLVLIFTGTPAKMFKGVEVAPEVKGYVAKTDELARTVERNTQWGLDKQAQYDATFENHEGRIGTLETWRSTVQLPGPLT